MRRSLGMQVSQDLGNRGQYRHSFPDTQLTSRLHQVRKGTSWREIHHQAQTAPCFAAQLHHIMNPDEVFVPKRRQDPNLTEGSFTIGSPLAALIPLERACDAFDGEPGMVLVPAGEPDRRGPTTAQVA
ncbi:hypothetical protein NtRootA1_16760 [Arthrobacter sp. NtRootA1]|nr:hypothetical protein NtRootA1_16760 [Arthrobacter sp. NtRootA1]